MTDRPQWMEITRPKTQPGDQQAALKAAYRKTFGTPEGRLVLEDLQKQYLDRPVCSIENVYYGYIREGENRAARRIMKMAGQAKE